MHLVPVRLIYRKPRTGKVRSPYVRRNETLLEMGFESYAAYLASSLWADIRRKVLERDRHECYSCPAKATQVHHSCYGVKTLEGECLTFLYSVCRSCHEWCEDKRGKKWGPGPEEATRRLRERKRTYEAQRKEP